jgi:hypothetical protein
MEREYSTGTAKDVVYFVGDEIEHTPAYGMRTLFVVGLQSIADVAMQCTMNRCNHIYFGANHSYDGNNIEAWEQLVNEFLKGNMWVTLDLDVRYYEKSMDSLCLLSESDRFILQISVKLPYISLLNYNTCVKLDDRDFRATNPGVWVHQLHDLQNRTKFTDWSKYTQDELIGNEEQGNE